MPKFPAAQDSTIGDPEPWADINARTTGVRAISHQKPPPAHPPKDPPPPPGRHPPPPSAKKNPPPFSMPGGRYRPRVARAPGIAERLIRPPSELAAVPV